MDAHLDPRGVEALARYVKKHSKNLQWIAISLNHTFFTNAEALVGIYKDKKTEVSGVLTLDLTTYNEQ